MKYLVKIINIKCRMMVGCQGLGGEETGSYYLMGTELQFCKMKRVLKMEDSDGYQTI